MTTDINASGTLPTDDEMDLLTDYLGGYLSEEDHQGFERRLEEDEDFFYRMAPMLDFWYSPDVLPAEMETLRELRADRPALEPATHSGLGRAAAWWHRQWVQLGTLAAASTLLCAALIRMFSSPQVMPMMATHAVHRPPVTPHQAVAVAVLPKPTTYRRSIAAPPTLGEPQMSDRAIEDALVASITRALPEARSAPSVGAVPATAVQAMPITAVEVPSQLPDSAAQNAEERARDLAAPKVPAGAGFVSGGVWQWFRDKMRGIHHPPIISKF
jgi:hypothetical protein